jgi:hypothetical protein
MLATAMSGLVPVEVVPEPPRVEAPVSTPATTTETSGVIDVAFPSGATVRVSGCVDMVALRSILAALGGR